MYTKRPFLFALCAIAMVFCLAGCSSVREAVQRSFSGGPWAVEAGPDGKYIYWLRSHYNDTDLQQVYRTSVNDGETDRIVGGTNVLDIAIDEKREHLYWSTQEGLVKRSRLDGSGAEVVADQPPHPTRIAFEETTGMLYWMTTPARPSYYETTLLTGGTEDKNTGLIQKVRVDTSASLGAVRLLGQPETIVDGLAPPRISPAALLGWLALEVDSANGSVFYGNERPGGGGVVYFTSRLGTNGRESQVFEWGRVTMGDAGDARPRMGFAVHSERNVLYHTTEEGAIVEVPYDRAGGTKPLVEAGVHDPTDVDVGPDGETLYWTQYAYEGEGTAGVYRADLDGDRKKLIRADSLVAPAS